jgi:hypothetical protein
MSSLLRLHIIIVVLWCSLRDYIQRCMCCGKLHAVRRLETLNPSICAITTRVVQTNKTRLKELQLYRSTSTGLFTLYNLVEYMRLRRKKASSSAKSSV